MKRNIILLILGLALGIVFALPAGAQQADLEDQPAEAVALGHQEDPGSDAQQQGERVTVSESHAAASARGGNLTDFPQKRI